MCYTQVVSGGNGGGPKQSIHLFNSVQFSRSHQMLHLRCMHFPVDKTYLNNGNVSVESVNYMHADVSRVNYRDVCN